MKLWVDDVRPAPNGYVWCKSVISAVHEILQAEALAKAGASGVWAKPEECVIELIDLDHDAGEYASCGGDFIKLLDWLEATGKNYPMHIHSINPVGVANMRRIIKRNGWKEV